MTTKTDEQVGVSMVEIDMLGYYLAEAAEFIEMAEAIKEKIKAAGEGSYEGALYRATCSEYDQNKLDMAAVRAKLSAQFIRANTTTSRVKKVTVHSRQGK